MAYKRNPMRAERINALARLVISLQQNGAQTAAAQWLERTLDDSANRRLVLPEAFLATDAILVLATNIVTGLEVREETIARHVAEQMPFMATERWMLLGVEAGGDRQELHEVIRSATHSAGASPESLLDRLATHPAFARVATAALRAELEPARYVGRAEAQVHDFLREYLDPVLARAALHATQTTTEEVRV
jgi:adenylosuccinate lyase